MKRPRIVGIGEVLWDHLPGGSTLGGAPANVASHACALGADAAVISRVGDDAAGATLLERLAAKGVATHGISVDPLHATGSVTVALDAAGQPEYVIAEPVAWDHLVAGAAELELVRNADAVCFGTLAQRSPQSAAAIRTLMQAAGPEVLRVLDVNLRSDDLSDDRIVSSLAMADVLKVNEAELPRIAAACGLHGGLRGQLAALLDRFGFRMVAYTRGAEGSVLFNGREWHEEAGRRVTLRDTIGAGDSFVTALTLGLLLDWPVRMISHAANDLAAHVCGMPGAVPELPAEMVRRFSLADISSSLPLSSSGAAQPD